MKFSRYFLPGLFAASLTAAFAAAPADPSNETMRVFSGALARLVNIIMAPTNQPPRTFTTTLKLTKGGGLSKELLGQQLTVAFQAPDHLRLASQWSGNSYVIGRSGQQLWVHIPAKKFGLIGSPEVPRFSAVPDSLDATPLGPFKLPVPPEQILVLPFLVTLEALPDERVGATECRVIKAIPKPEAIQGFHLPQATIQVWVREPDLLPLKLAYRDPTKADIEIEVANPELEEPWPDSKWRLPRNEDDTVQTVARAHLLRFLSSSYSMLTEKIPVLGPASGERRVIAREGKGRLEMHDGTRVLFLEGTPEEMGHQHGALLIKEIRNLVDHVLYGVGVGSSFLEGRWFFGAVEAAQKRLKPFISDRSFREMDALADAAGLEREEVRLSNFFPELFHCSGFAIFGKATEGGRMYHGRVLDYMRGMGMEQNAVVIVFKPDQGNAWVNVSYAGFIGSVTAMNEKQVAIGEMGGRGEGNWDGKPMAQLVREVMEKANTLEEAVEIMRRGPRTCEYYYVISDAKSKKAVGIAATPGKFETVLPNQAHALLPHPVEDAVLMSAGDRYEELAKRVQAGFGKFDDQRARDLMRRPVAMNSNLHCALFAPDTLDFWVANADSRNPAAHTRYTHYNLRELLQPERPASGPKPNGG
ncbi:MAG TPA: C45 family peptidase [Verrucomicrobiae bacterium]